ncbi:MAG: winged helix-turn-helix transcriptional regulator [Candidatus Dormibacteria bacterium]
MSEATEEEARPGLEEALERVGDRWALLLVDALMTGPQRYSDLRRALPTIASNVLSERLRRLEQSGVVQAREYSRRPPRLEYRLSERGQSLAAVVEALQRWGGGREGGPPHGRCGTPMEVRWYCPTCAEVAQPEQGGADDELVFA